MACKEYPSGTLLQLTDVSGPGVVRTEVPIDRLPDGVAEFFRWLADEPKYHFPDQLIQLGRVLGPRGLMPNPKVGTVTFDVGRVVKEMKGGRVEYRTEKTGIVHAPVGKASFDADKLRDNVLAIIENLTRAKPSTSKGIYMETIALSSTHGPGVRLDPTHVQQQVKL